MAVDHAAAAADKEVPADVLPGADKSDSEDDGVADPGVDDASAKKKKKKKPKKKKKADYAGSGGGVPPEITPSAEETAEVAAKWAAELRRGVRTFSIDPWALLNERDRPKLNMLRTPACADFALRTPRLVLRQVGLGDTTAIRRIKMEPVVQRTQLYGSPSASDIKDSFQRRYIAASVPALEKTGAWRDEWVFAITAKDPPSIKLAPPGLVRIANRLPNAEGYLGNFALSLETSDDAHLGPRKGKVYTHPTYDETAAAQLEGRLFYELHPQVWGQGLASEAFSEVLRFAFEEAGCVRVLADPTSTSDASIRLCVKNGMTFTHESTDNPFKKPQLFHAMTADEWFARNRGVAKRPSGPGPWGGKETCRWCTDFRRRPVFTCKCGWAKYCSRECQRADWVFVGGHQRHCDAEP